jgi:hypothetical protein
MTYKALIMIAALAMAVPSYAKAETDPAVVTIDENLWVAFYDVPSRRFRDIRAAFVRREFTSASKNLATSANYLTIEANRALPAIAERLNDVSGRMTWIAKHIDDVDVTTTDLDALFSRSHWLLAQHFLDMARRSRDSAQNKNAGLYLWATTHHLERAVLWSNSRISRDVQKTLADLRDLADQLQDETLVTTAYRNRPLARADKLLRELGKTIDRPVVLPAGKPEK